MKILITGVTGLLGPYLVEACQGHTISTTSLTGGDYPCDLRDNNAVSELVANTPPEVVIHSAAITNVNECENNLFETMEVNCNSVYRLARQVKKLVYICTDQVYPDSEGPHEEDFIGPVNLYGKSKLAGEHADKLNTNMLTLRTNFFGPSKVPWKESISDWIINNNSKPITLYTDRLFSPLHMTTLAKLIVELIEKDVSGTYNLGSRNGLSKAQFGLLVAKHKNLPTVPETGKSPCTGVHRAHDLRMDVRRIERVLGRFMPSLEEEIEKL